MSTTPLRRMLGAALVLALAVGAGACGSSKPGRVALDGSPRVPDAEGIVETIPRDFSTLTLDGGRTYKVAKDVQSFSTADGSTQPLLSRRGQYVQLGLDGDKHTVRWVAGIASVVQVDGDHRAVYYRGRLAHAKGQRLDFADGTVLHLAPGLSLPTEAVGKLVVATIDPAKRVVTTVSPQ